MKQISFDQMGAVGYLLNRPCDAVQFEEPRDMVRIMKDSEIRGTVHIYFADFSKKKPRRLIDYCMDYFSQIYVAVKDHTVHCTVTGNGTSQRRENHNLMIDLLLDEYELREEIPTAVLVRSKGAYPSYYFHDTYAYVNNDIGSNYGTSIVNELKKSGIAYSFRKEANPGEGFEIMFINDNKILLYRAVREDVAVRKMREKIEVEKKKIAFARSIEEIVVDERDDLDRIHFISDLHLDHDMIIKYCNRPFKSVQQMNKEIVANWNTAVNQTDLVYFLGDLSHGKHQRGTSYWLGKLDGQVRFVKGNHDLTKGISFYDKLILRYKDQKFLLIHDPKTAIGLWDGWIIHGHVHNHFSHSFPLMNLDTKTINVSAEVLNYRPISLKGILELVPAE